MHSLEADNFFLCHAFWCTCVSDRAWVCADYPLTMFWNVSRKWLVKRWVFAQGPSVIRSALKSASLAHCFHFAVHGSGSGLFSRLGLEPYFPETNELGLWLETLIKKNSTLVKCFEMCKAYVAMKRPCTVKQSSLPKEGYNAVVIVITVVVLVMIVVVDSPRAPKNPVSGRTKCSPCSCFFPSVQSWSAETERKLCTGVPQRDCLLFSRWHRDVQMNLKKKWRGELSTQRFVAPRLNLENNLFSAPHQILDPLLLFLWERK